MDYDLDLLVAAPVDWFTLDCRCWLEIMWNSSWMVVLMAVPMFAAFGAVVLTQWAGIQRAGGWHGRSALLLLFPQRSGESAFTLHPVNGAP